MRHSLFVKLAMLAIAVLLVLWIGWPGSTGTREPVQVLPAPKPEQVTARPPETDPGQTRKAPTGETDRPCASLPQPPGPKPSRLDLNKATVEELQGLPGVGPVLAARIVERRTKRGPFQRIEELQDVKGIGRKRVEQLRPLVQVGERGGAPGARGPARAKKGRE